MTATTAHADDLRDRTIGHVITAPTAWMPDGITTTAGVDRFGNWNVGGTLGYGIASIELARDTEDDLKRATFRIGARQDSWFAGQPAVAFGVRSTWGTEDAVADAFLVASRDLGPVRLHAGASIADSAASPRKSFEQELRQIRPLGGIEWTPGQYPRTTLMGDIVWAGEKTIPDPRFTTGVAVRYQAFRWGSVDFGVRYRDGQQVDEASFFARINATTR